MATLKWTISYRQKGAMKVSMEMKVCLRSLHEHTRTHKRSYTPKLEHARKPIVLLMLKV